MNIYTLKIQFEEKVLPAPAHRLVNARQAWEIFKASVSGGLDENTCEELGFSTSIGCYQDGKAVHYDESQFQIYFGRLIDAEKGQRWRTAEVNFYYRYAMTAELRHLLTEPADIEIAYCKSEAESAIRHKLETVFAFAEEQHKIWAAIEALEPVNTSYHFWIE